MRESIAAMVTESIRIEHPGEKNGAGVRLFRRPLFLIIQDFHFSPAIRQFQAAIEADDIRARVTFLRILGKGDREADILVRA